MSPSGFEFGGMAQANSAAAAGQFDDQYKYVNGLAYLGNSADSYVNAYNQGVQWAREDAIRREGYAREDSAYERFFDQMKKLGVNPVLALSGSEPIAGAYSNSTSSIKTSNYETTSRTDQANNAKVAGSILAALAILGAAIIGAL